MSEATADELFAPGEKNIVWKERVGSRRKALLVQLKQAYGEGPFEAIEVRDAVGARRDEHPQTVLIRRVGDTAKPFINFSGSWFTHAPQD